MLRIILSLAHDDTPTSGDKEFNGGSIRVFKKYAYVLS